MVIQANVDVVDAVDAVDAVDVLDGVDGVDGVDPLLVWRGAPGAGVTPREGVSI